MNVAAENTNYKYFAGALQMRFSALPFLAFLKILQQCPIFEAHYL